jgi:hypothetical protein
MAHIGVAGDLYIEIDGQLHEIKRQLRQKEGYPYDPCELKAALQTLIEGKFPAQQEVFPVTVNYGLTVEKLVNAGKYDWSNSDINAKNFPSDRKDAAEVAIELVHFGRSMESDEVLEELDKQGLRPATLAELLAFGVKYPEKQREFPIVALGSVWRGRNGFRSVACLCGYTDARSLSLRWLGSLWSADFRFAAVRK